MKLAVYFPDIGYHCDKPLLYYARKVASEKGFENYLNIEYTFKGQNIRGDHKKECYALFRARAECAALSSFPRGAIHRGAFI